MLDGHAFLMRDGIEDLHHTFCTEQTHQVIIQGNVESGFARVALTAGTAAQLVIDTSGLMALSADDLETPELGNAFTQLDIGTTAGHVGGDGNCPHLTCFGNDLGLEFMELGIEDVMLDPFGLQDLTDLLRTLDRGGTHQNRLALGVGFLDLGNDSIDLFFMGHVDHIVVVNTDNLLVGRDLDNVKPVDITEFFLFRHGRTSHTGSLGVFVEEVLEGNGGQSLALTADLYAFLGFNGLMEAIRITAARHDTSGELIDDQDLAVLDHIVLIPEHQIIGTQGQGHDMLDLQVLSVSQVIEMEVLLNLVHAFFCQDNMFFFLIDNKVTGLLDLLAHDGRHLVDLTGTLALGHMLGQIVTHIVEGCGLVALSGDDQRCTGFIDQDGVDLVDDGIVKISLNQVFLIDSHVVTEVVKTQLVVGRIGDIAVIGFLALFRRHGV